MQVLNPDSAQIDALIENRWPDKLSWPEHFQVAIPNWQTDIRYTIQQEAKISGIGSFSNQHVEITISPCLDARPSMQDLQTLADPIPLQADHINLGEHNIQLGPIKIIEHPLAIMTALNLDINFKLSLPDFPTFDYCNQPYLDAVIPQLIPIAPLPYCTVKAPLLLQFESGYLLLEPDDGQQALILDHQIDYPGKAVGRQRIQFTLNAERFCFLARARTPSFRPVDITAGIIQQIKTGQLKEFPVTLENVLFTDEEQIHNPRQEFLYKEHNYEFLAHEVIDIICIFKLIEIQLAAKFVGRMTSYRFGHREQVMAAQYFSQHPDLFK